MGGTGIYLLDSDAAGGLPQSLPAQGGVVCTTAAMMVTPGRCYVNIALLKGGVMEDYLQYATTFDLHDGEMYGAKKVPGRDWMMCVIGQDWAKINETPSCIAENLSVSY
jgi:lipopolysaccharide transport system ATP-binding protein